MAPSRHEDEGGQLQLIDADRVEEEEECFESIDKRDKCKRRELQDARIYTCNGLMMHNKKNITGIKGLCEVKVDKICVAAEKLLNQGFMTGNDLLHKVPLTEGQRTETIISYTTPKAIGRIKALFAKGEAGVDADLL